MTAPGFRTFTTRACALVFLVLVSFNPLSAALIMSDGFGDGDRDNNGLDTGATATDPSESVSPGFSPTAQVL